jgi:hypothetical protein
MANQDEIKAKGKKGKKAAVSQDEIKASASDRVSNEDEQAKNAG